MPHFASAGTSVHYVTEGKGPPILMIAGIASDIASWAPLIPLLSKHHQLVMIDNRGSGRTRYAGTLNIGDMVDDCVHLLDGLRISRANVVGHSLGGMIGLRLASLYPERVERLVTMATANPIGPKERVLFKDMARLYARIEPQLWFRLLYHWLFSDPAFFSEEAIAAAAEGSTAYPHRQSPKDFAKQVQAIDRMRPLILEAIRCPVLAIAAERDLLVPPELVQSGHERIGILSTVTIPNAGHSVHWEAPKPVAEAILGFLRDQSVASPVS